MEYFFSQSQMKHRYMANETFKSIYEAQCSSDDCKFQVKLSWDGFLFVYPVVLRDTRKFHCAGWVDLL